MKVSNHPKFCFPRLRRVKLERFSLYAQHPDIDLEVTPGVFCMAGANGIGKSTFLAAVNFALTGRVPTPQRSYKSTDEYYSESAKFSLSFFEGRIEEDDRSTASISLELEIGNRIFSITRGVFAPDELRSLHVAKNNGRRATVEFNGEDMSESQRQEEYAKRITESIGLRSFDQFVFLQHFVFTFDESRSLLFWNNEALESALFLGFGTDPQEQIIADVYRREMERAGSRGRNYRFHALRVKSRIDIIKAALGTDKAPTADAVELEAEYDSLMAERDKAFEDAANLEASATDADVGFANASAALITLRSEYAQAFGRHVADRSLAARHPLVLEATAEQRCAVCGSESEAVASVVSKKVNAHVCPLCDTSLTTQGSADDLETLRRLDHKIAKVKGNLDAAGRQRERLAVSLAKARERATAATVAMRDFEKRNDEVAKRVQGRAAAQSGPQQELQRLEAEFNTLLHESKQAYADRDTWKDKLQNAQKKLERQYQTAEKDFVPVFRELAKEFLGIDLDITVEPRGTTGIALVPELRHSKRRLGHQLSESQRFFLDIALRMALARFISEPSSQATLFIDTPEGSLDIAYESRAGAMFAKFARSGHDILMTANINTSALLRKLAAECGDASMALVRMTEWADLSDVQLAESELFEDAYTEIEEELHGRAE